MGWEYAWGYLLVSSGLEFCFRAFIPQYLFGVGTAFGCILVDFQHDLQSLPAVGTTVKQHVYQCSCMPPTDPPNSKVQVACKWHRREGAHWLQVSCSIKSALPQGPLLLAA